MTSAFEGGGGHFAPGSGGNKRKGNPDPSSNKRQATLYGFDDKAMAYLQTLGANQNIAFAFFREDYPSQTRKHTCLYSFGDNQQSAVTQLIQGGYDDAFRRHRDKWYNMNIRVKQGTAVNPMDTGMNRFATGKVAVSYSTVQSGPFDGMDEWAQGVDFHQMGNLLGRAELTNLFAPHDAGAAPTNVDLYQTNTPQGQSSQHTVHRLYMMVAFYLAYKMNVSLNGQEANGNRIGAVLTDRNGQLLSWGVNTANVNHTFHAEVNAIQSHIARSGADPDPNTEFVLFTSLQPCYMCSGMINHYFNGNIKVYYGQADAGTHVNPNLGPTFIKLGSQGTKPIRFKVHQPTNVSLQQGVAYSATPHMTVTNNPANNTTTSKVTDFADYLDFCYTNRPNPNPNKTEMIKFVNNSTWAYLARTVFNRIQQKKNGYDIKNANQPNPRVQSVLQHLYPFLISPHVTP